MIYNITNADYSINQESLERLRGDFETVSKVAPPKIVKLGDAMHRYNLIEDINPSLPYVKHLLNNLHREPVTKETFGAKMSNPDDNNNFHAVKLMYLIHTAMTTGFYSYCQACIHTKRGTPKWFVHPGQFREKALIHCGQEDAEFIVWDSQNMIEAPLLSFDDWSSKFLHNAEHERDLHIAVHNEEHKKIVEFHVGEDRPAFYDLAQQVFEMYGGKKPYLIGECNDSIAEYFSNDESSNVHVHAHQKLQESDLMILLTAHPNIGDIRTDSLTISRK